MMTKLAAAVEAHRDTILAAGQYIWEHPETGYREENTSRYFATG